MKKLNNKLILALAIILITCVIYYYEEVKAHTTGDISTSKIVVANIDIPENTVITESMILVDNRYTHDLIKQQGSIVSDPADVVGKRTIVPIYKNEIINIKRLTSSEEDLEEGKQQFVIPVTDKMKALDIRKGSYLNIWSMPSKEDISAGHEPEIIFSKIKALDVKDAEFISIGEKGVPAYIIVSLTTEEIKEYKTIREKSGVFLSLYGEENLYQIMEDILKLEETEDASPEEDASSKEIKDNEEVNDHD